jgi:hypothetical protein
LRISGSDNHEVMMLAARSRSPIVSKSGTTMMAAAAGSCGRYRPASFSRMLTSSMSETLSHFEMM